MEDINNMKKLRDKLDKEEKTGTIMSIDELELPVRTYNVLRKNGFNSIKDLLKFGNLNKIPNLGRKSYNEIVERLNKYGFDLAHYKLSATESEKDYSKYNCSIDELGLSSRTHVALRNAGVKTLGDILLFQDAGYLSEIYRIGKKAIKEIETLIRKLDIKSTDEPVDQEETIEVLRTETEELEATIKEKEEKSKLLDEYIELAKQHSELKIKESKLDEEIKKKEETLKEFGFKYEKKLN